MRRPFTELSRLKKVAKHRVESESDHLERFFEQRYDRPAFGGKFEDKSAAFWQLELLTEAWRRRKEIHESIKVQGQMGGAKNPQVKQRMHSSYTHLRAIEALFDDGTSAEGLTSQWDKQLRGGGSPDMAGHMANLKVPASLQAELDRQSKPAKAAARG
jgi:hypothetical protein